MSDVIDEHRQYLSDRPRMEAYKAAIGKLVKPGDVVVDLGAGSGILGLLACRAGARKVYAIEETSLIELTREIARQNGYVDKIVHIKEVSTRVELPEKANVVLCDQVGRFGFDAGVLEYFADARRRMLAPEGCFIPGAVELHVAAIESEQLSADARFWTGDVHGFDMRPAARIARNSGYPCKLLDQTLLSTPACLIRLQSDCDQAFAAEVEVTAARAGIVHGIGGWFRAELAPGVFMTNSPLSPDRIRRRNVFFPIAEPVLVEAGDTLSIRFQVIPRESIVSWSVVVSAQSGARRAEFQHSTFQGILIAAEDLRRTRPDMVPKLSSWGRARASVLELCDGSRSLADIEKAFFAKHPDLFRTNAEASMFVAEVLTRYAE